MDLKNVVYLLQHQSASDVDVDVISRNPHEYRKLKEVVEKSKVKNKYVSGEANDLIKHCIYLPISEGYENTPKLLRVICGYPYIAMHHHLSCFIISY